ncbi:MAG: hypothetical protein HOK30_25060 [Rhodospirillaceae bacterium]|jgi:adenylate cyclase|nr:hypothetical protein [Rhodospirillaceae bacterium]MBT6430961.1 hypothetical protein [Rhodospirillaceae bacterium]MBT7759320.1 hypothetical protein [Rhodospirillaceae bacterium]
MAEGDRERRLAAIVSVDVAGYSRLMGADEQGTLAALTVHRDAMASLVESHAGRLVGQAGDGLLFEFPSVVEAVTCAIEVQTAMAARNQDIPDARKMLYRIGINLGDVLVEGDDIFGDGVNVAARIEALAEPGGICISHTVHDQIRDRMAVPIEDMGEVEVKNIARPVRVFRVLTAPGIAKAARSPWMSRGLLRGAAAVIIVIIVAMIAVGGTWWWQQRPDFEPADQARFAYKLPDKPSIAVLPFDNMSGDPKQDYIGDGLTENIIAALATSPDLFVIARNSSFIFKGKATKVQEVAEQLGVRFVLEGSIQRSGDKLRVIAQLVDAIDGKHIWTGSYDRELKDLFALYDGITRDIAVEMHINLTAGKQGRFWINAAGAAESYRLGVLGRSLLNTSTVAGLKEAETLFMEAYSRKPGSALVNLFVGAVHYQKVFIGISKDPLSDLAQSRTFVEKSLSITESAHALSYLAMLELLARNHDLAIGHADRAVELDPSSSDALAAAGMVKSNSGEIHEGIELLRRAMRLQPYHPSWFPLMLGWAQLQLGENDAAGKMFDAVIASANVDGIVFRMALASRAVIAVFEGNMDLAHQYLEKVLEKHPSTNLYEANIRLYFMKDRDFAQRYIAALRQAGLQEY